LLFALWALLYTLLLWRRVNLEQLKAPPEVEVDSHPLWGWESKEASLSLRRRSAPRGWRSVPRSPPRLLVIEDNKLKGGKEGLITCYLRGWRSAPLKEGLITWSLWEVASSSGGGYNQVNNKLKGGKEGLILVIFNNKLKRGV